MANDSFAVFCLVDVGPAGQWDFICGKRRVAVAVAAY